MVKRRKPKVVSIKSNCSLEWVLEPLENRSDYLQKRMFGCRAAYLGSRIVLVLADGEEPWNGVLIPTERELHPAIQAEFPSLQSHPVLGKWLYLSQGHPDFEEISTNIVKYLLSEDPRFGVEPKPKKTNPKPRR